MNSYGHFMIKYLIQFNVVIISTVLSLLTLQNKKWKLAYILFINFPLIENIQMAQNQWFHSSQSFTLFSAFILLFLVRMSTA